MNTVLNIRVVRKILELVFILVFVYSIFFEAENYVLILRISTITFLAFTLSILLSKKINKEAINNLFNPDIIFFIVLSAAQTIKNIYYPCGLPVLLYETIHYLITIFVLFYNLRIKRPLDTGLVLFVAYSFRIFDFSIADNEFVFIHGLTLILALIWLEGIYTKKLTLPKIKSISLPLAIFIIIMILSTINAVCSYNSLALTLIMINFIFVIFLIASNSKNIKQVNLLIVSLFSIGGVLTILVLKEVLYKLLTGVNICHAFGQIWLGRAGDIAPTIHYNSIAGFFAVLLCLITGGLLFGKSVVLRRTAFLLTVIMLFVLALTFSRLGILSCISALAILFVLRHKGLANFFKKGALYLILSLIFISALIITNPIKEKIVNRFKHAHWGLVTLYSCQITLEATKNSPLLGYGFGNYYILSKYTNKPMDTPFVILTPRDLAMSAPHSLYLGIAFGTGITGLLLFIWLLFAFIVYCLRLNSYIRDEGYEKGLLQGIFAAFIALIIQGILSMTFHLTILPAFFWILMGLAISIGNIKRYHQTTEFELTSWQVNLSLIAIFLISLGVVVNPLLAEKNYILAFKHFNTHRLNEARKEVDRAKRLIPINPKFYKLSARIQERQGLIDEAIESYKKALSLKRDYAFYHSCLGQLYRQKKLYANAFMEFKKAIELDRFGTYFREHYSDLGRLYQDLGNEKEAIRQFKTAVLIEPRAGCKSEWGGRNYLRIISEQLSQDYGILKEKEPLLARQILYSLGVIKMCEGGADSPGR